MLECLAFVRPFGVGPLSCTAVRDGRRPAERSAAGHPVATARPGRRRASSRLFFAFSLAASAAVTHGTQAASIADTATPSPGQYFVSPDGNGVSTARAAPGNVNDTVRAICDGTAAQIRGGDTIVFLDGVYLTSAMNLGLPADEFQPGRHGNAVGMVNKNCGDGEYIRFLSETHLGAVIRNDVTSNDTSGGFDVRRSSYIWIEGFRIEGVNDPAVIWEGGIKFSHGSHHVVARRNRIDRSGGGGIGAGESTHVRIEDNEIHDTANTHPFCASAISLYRMENKPGFADNEDGYSNYIIGNRVSGTRSRQDCDADADSSNGVQSSDGNCIILDLFNQTGYANRTLIANNVCADNGGGGVHVFNSGHTDVINNTLYGNGVVHPLAELSVTCNVASQVRDVRFINNLVWPTHTAPAVATNWGGPCVMDEIVVARNVFVGDGPARGDFEGVPFPSTTPDRGALTDCATDNLVGVAPEQLGVGLPGAAPAAEDFAIRQGSSVLIDAGVGANCRRMPSTESACSSEHLPAPFSRDAAGHARSRGNGIDVGAFEYVGMVEPAPESGCGPGHRP